MAIEYRGRTISKVGFNERLTKELSSGRLREPVPRLERIPPRRPRHLLRLATGVSAASATAVLLAAFNQPPRWTALPGAGSGNLFVDGSALSVSDTGGLTRRIHTGSRIRLESTEDLNLVSSGLLAMQLAPGTEMVLPSPPGRWFGRAYARITGGRLRVTTGRRYSGARFAIRTPEATIRVTGTTLAVIAEPTGTCVCVLEGSAYVRPLRGETVRVASGSRYEVPHGAHGSGTGEISVAERAKLADLRDRMRAVMD